MAHQMNVNLSRMACGAVLPTRLLSRSGLTLSYQRYKGSLIPFPFPNRSSNTSRPEHGIRLFCDMPERKKYQHIRITSEHESIDHAFRFLMDILKRPRLGQFVERIEFIRTPDLSDDYPAKDYERELNPEDMGLLRTAVRDAGFVGPKEERVVNMLMQKTPGNYIMDRKGPFVINQ